MVQEIFRIENGQPVKGAIFNILLHNNGYYLVDLKVYADGYIDCLGRLDLEELKAHIRSGKLARQLPEGQRVFIPYIGYVTAVSSEASYSNERFIAIIEDTIRQLNHEDHKRETARKFREFLVNDCEANLNALRTAYIKIPVNERALFEIENKDPLVKLMTDNVSLTAEQRRYLLDDYFDGEYIELKS